MRTIEIILNNKKTWLSTIIVCAFSICLHAQKETEVFIPIGKSPGVSGKYSMICTVQTIQMNDSIMTIKQDSGNMNLMITEQTKVYLDKSRLKLQNKKGTVADIKPGMTMEVKYIDNKPGNPIDWIKVLVE
jgi:hypothetical protein